MVLSSYVNCATKQMSFLFKKSFILIYRKMGSAEKMFIGGKWVEGASGLTFLVR